MKMRSMMGQTAKRSVGYIDNGIGGVESFLKSRLCDNGLFADRSGTGDLYYTMFAVEALKAIGSDDELLSTCKVIEDVDRFIESDLIHLSAYLRLLVSLRRDLFEINRRRLVEALERYRSADGGFSMNEGANRSSAYGLFTGIMSLQELGEVVDLVEVQRLIESFKLGDGGYMTDTMIPVSSVPACSLVLAMQCALGLNVDRSAAEWMVEECFDGDGFSAFSGAGGADLLSTGVGLFSLGLCGKLPVGLERVREFVRLHLDQNGGYASRAGDADADCEYTYYALLAYGAMAV